MKEKHIFEQPSLDPGVSDCSNFCRLFDQNKIYNLIHYSRVACTRTKMVSIQITVV